MAQEMLLINPRRRKAKKTSRRRRRNPIAGRSASMRISGAKRHHRRRNPIASFGRRRRNPISIGGTSSKNVMQFLKDAAIGGAGGILMDVVMGQLNGFLPASFQSSKSTIGVGDAVKAGVTVALGQILAKPTKGLSKKLAAGALTVQAYEVMSSFVPSTLTLGGVGYASPAAIVQGSNRVGPTRAGMLQAYQRPGSRPPLLNAYLPSGRSPLLNGRVSVQSREGVSTYR